MNKCCSKCLTIKPIEEFCTDKRNKDGHTSTCFVCNRKQSAVRSKKYRINHPEKVAAYSKEYRQSHKEYLFKLKKRWNDANKERINCTRKESLKRRISGDRNYAIRYYLKANISNGINYSLGGNKGGSKWEGLLNYDAQTLRLHLESKFLPGMSWENKNQWHIDHKRPISSFTFLSPNDPEFKECWSLENLQPLWAADNLKKGSRWEVNYEQD